MDFVYSLDLSSYVTKQSDECGEAELKCALSSRNMVAFSSGSYIYLLPLEKPNELIPISLSSSKCTHLVWSDDSDYLLSVYDKQKINVYNIKTNSLNSVDMLVSFSVDKEENVLQVKQFSKTPKLCYNYERRDSTNLLEKFYQKPFNILKNFGKFNYDGFLVLTELGNIHVCLTNFNSVNHLLTKTPNCDKFDYSMNLRQLIQEQNADQEMHDDTMRREALKFDLGDFSFEPDGSINILLTNYDLATPIYMFKVSLKLINSGATLEGSAELVSILDIRQSLGESVINGGKSKLLFTSNESPQSFCVVVRSGPGGTGTTLTDQIQLWRVTQPDGGMDLSHATSKECVLVKSVQCPADLIDLAIPKSSIAYKDLIDNRLYSQQVLFLTASFRNGTSCFLDLLNFNNKLINLNDEIKKQVGSVFSIEPDQPPEYMLALDQSNSGLIGVGLTNKASLVVFRNQSFNTAQLPLINLYEYNLMTGYDHWDLIVNTSPKQVQDIIEKLEERCSFQPKSLQKIFFSRLNTVLFSLYLNSNHTHQQFKLFDILVKQMISKSMAIVSQSIQHVLNIENIKKQLEPNVKITSTLFNSSLGLSYISSNTEQLNTQVISPSNSSSTSTNTLNPVLAQISYQGNLYAFLTELFDQSTIKQLNLDEIAQFVHDKRNYYLHVSQQLRHLLQFSLDLALYLTNVIITVKSGEHVVAAGSDHPTAGVFYGIGLLNDSSFVKQILKLIVYMKLLFNQVNQLQQTQSPNAPNTMALSLPILPLRTSMQKDLLSDLFNIYISVLVRISEGGSILNDEEIVTQCLNVQAETMCRQLDEVFSTVRQPWIGVSAARMQHFQVDRLFEPERTVRQLYPLFDIIRLIQFSRSPNTKQCIRCGNFTESNSSGQQLQQDQATDVKQNCIFIQDLSSGEKCLCGGCWVLSPLQ